MKYINIGIIFAFFLAPAASAEERHYSQKFAQCSKEASTADGQAGCVTAEILAQKKLLNVAYANLIKKLAPEDKEYLEKAQHQWIAWRDENYKFLAEHVSGSFGTTRATSLDFILRTVFDRVNELEMISDEMGAN